MNTEVFRTVATAKEYRAFYPPSMSLSSNQGRTVVQQMVNRFPLLDVVEAWGFAPRPYTSLRQAVRTSGITQTYLAAFLGVTPAAVCQWVTGERKPAKQHQEALHLLFGDSLSLPSSPSLEQYVRETGQWAEYLLWCGRRAS